MKAKRGYKHPLFSLLSYSGHSRSSLFSFYPAPGFRDALGDRGYGRLWYVGYGGYGWSSFASGGNVRFLDFNSNRLVPQNNIDRAYGFQLRCLQEHP